MKKRLVILDYSSSRVIIEDIEMTEEQMKDCCEVIKNHIDEKYNLSSPDVEYMVGENINIELKL